MALDREHRFYDPHSWQYRGLEVQAASGERDFQCSRSSSLLSLRRCGQ